jgi:hypothetical protein
MLKITAQRAAALEALGQGSFQVRNRTIIFTGADGKSAIWGPMRSITDAETQLRSWRRVFNSQV